MINQQHESRKLIQTWFTRFHMILFPKQLKSKTPRLSWAWPHRKDTSAASLKSLRAFSLSISAHCTLYRADTVTFSGAVAGWQVRCCWMILGENHQPSTSNIQQQTWWLIIVHEQILIDEQTICYILYTIFLMVVRWLWCSMSDVPLKKRWGSPPWSCWRVPPLSSGTPRTSGSWNELTHWTWV